MDTYGPQLGGEIIINAPRRSCDGKIGTVVSLHLATNEATVQVAGGTRHIVLWDEAKVRHPDHGTRARYEGTRWLAPCHCLECTDAEAAYGRAYRARKKKEAS